MIRNDEKRDTVIRLFKEENRTPKSLSEEYGVPISTVYVWLRQSKQNFSKEQVKDITDYSKEERRQNLFEVIKEKNNQIKELEGKIKVLEDNVAFLTQLLNIKEEELNKLR